LYPESRSQDGTILPGLSSGARMDWRESEQHSRPWTGRREICQGGVESGRGPRGGVHPQPASERKLAWRAASFSGAPVGGGLELGRGGRHRCSRGGRRRPQAAIRGRPGDREVRQPAGIRDGSSDEKDDDSAERRGWKFLVVEFLACVVAYC
jgi:hypothetical protein